MIRALKVEVAVKF